MLMAGSNPKPYPPVIERRIIAPRRRSPDVSRIVFRHVDHLRIGRRDVNGRLPALRLGRNRLLRSGREPAVGLRPRAHPLHRGHHVGLLRQERIAQCRGPLDVLVQLRQHVRKGHQGLDAGVPILLPGRIHQLLARQIAIPLQPLPRLHNLQRVGARHQNLAQQRIGIERDGRHQVVQLFRRQQLRRRQRSRGRRGLLRQERPGWEHEQQQHANIIPSVRRTTRRSLVSFIPLPPLLRRRPSARLDLGRGMS